MSLLALVNLLRDYPMQRRFMACPLLKAADLLLQERVPKTAASVLSEDLKLEESRTLAGNGEAVMRVFTNPTPPAPEVHLLSNGRYHVVDQQRRRRLQSLARSGGHPLARGRHARLLGDVCLSARSGDGRYLVCRASTYLARGQGLRSHLHPGARGVSATSCRPRNPHRDQRVAGRRRGVAAHHDHQSFLRGASH